MRRTTALWEVFMTRFEDAFDQYKRRRLTSEKPGSGEIAMHPSPAPDRIALAHGQAMHAR
jgi:hypothetical protein